MRGCGRWRATSRRTRTRPGWAGCCWRGACVRVSRRAAVIMVVLDGKTAMHYPVM